MLFAELFALVNLNEENLSNTLTSNKTIKLKENLEQDKSLNLKNDEEFLLTKSLAETFYKELGINEKDFGITSKENNQNNSEINLKSSQHQKISEFINHIKTQHKNSNQLKNLKITETTPKENLQNNLESVSNFKIVIMSPKQRELKTEKNFFNEDKQKSENVLTKNIKNNAITENKNTLNINSQNNSKEIFVSSKDKKASRKKIQNEDHVQKNSEEKSFILTDKKQLLLKQPLITPKN